MEKVKIQMRDMEYNKSSLPIIDTPEEDNRINEAEKNFQNI